MSGQKDTEGDGEEKLFGYDQCLVDGELWAHCPGCDKNSVRDDSDKIALSQDGMFKMVDCPNCGFSVYQIRDRPTTDLLDMHPDDVEFDITFSDEVRDMLGGNSNDEEEEN